MSGRKIFANLLKYIRMGASSAFGNMFSVVGASAFLPFIPMAPIQILTQTLIVHVIRTNKFPFLQSRASWPLLVTTAVIMIIGMWLPISPIAQSLGFVIPPSRYWPLLALTLVGYVLFTQGVKVWLLRKAWI